VKVTNPGVRKPEGGRESWVDKRGRYHQETYSAKERKEARRYLDTWKEQYAPPKKRPARRRRTRRIVGNPSPAGIVAAWADRVEHEGDNRRVYAYHAGLVNSLEMWEATAKAEGSPALAEIARVKVRELRKKWRLT